MGATTIYDLIGAYNVKDFGAKGDDNADDGPAISHAMAYAAAQSPAGATVFLPPRTYRIVTPIDWSSNVELVGAGSRSILKLGPSALTDVIRATGVSNIRGRNFRVDGNRSNNTSGNGVGIWLVNVTDAWFEGVEVVSCRSDGWRVDVGTRNEWHACKASDNGRHGFSLSQAEFCQIVGARSYDNCQVATAGTADGINLELFSKYNVVIAPVCYETAGVGDYQGYGFREASASGCEQNVLIGGGFWGNRTGDYVLDSGDSMAITTPVSTLPANIILTA